MAPANPNGTSAAPWIPLRDDYFEAPLLSKKETQYLVRKACEAAQEVVERARSTGGPVQWRHVEKYNDVQLYAGFSRGTYSAEPTTMCGVTSVPGSLKEIASLFDLATTRSMKEFARAHRELFFDAVVLHTLSPRTREHPLHQVTAKWIATRSPKGLDDRDYCYLECQDKFTDAAGRKGWVLCLHSIKLPGCDDLTREFGFVRGSFYHSGLVVVEADRPGFVDIIHILQMNLKHNTKMPPSYLRERVAWIGKIKTILREKRLNEQRYLSDLELVPKKYRSRCHVCHDSFGLLLLRKMNCRKCGEVVCGACSKDFDVTNAKFLETVKLRICMHCYQLITAGQMLGTILDEPRASTSLSLLGYYDDTQRASIITDPTAGAHHGYDHPNGNGNGRAGGDPRGRGNKIILHSMAQQRADRRARRTIAHAHGANGGHPMNGHMGPPPPPMGDGRRTRGAPRQSMGNGYAYTPSPDSRSLFDKPRSSTNSIPSPAPPSNMPTTPASLFDRQSTRVRLDDFDAPRSEESKSVGQVPLSAPSPRSSKPRGSTRESRGNFKIPHSLYDYSDLDGDAPKAPSSPIQRPRGDSNSSVSSTGSIDIDSYEVVKANAATAAAAKNGARPESTIDEGHSYPNARTPLADDGDDTEGSIGSGDDEPNYQSRERASNPRMPPTYYEDEEEEETKTDEFGTTPALPPPSPSAYTAMHAALLSSGRQDSLDLPFHRRNFNVSDLSVNTADCDTSYLDTQMRQFHGQPFYMRGTTTDSDPRATIDFSVGSSPRNSTEGQPMAQGGSPNSVEVASPVTQPPPMATSPPRNVMTSPRKSIDMVVRPPLYGRPKKNDPATFPSSLSSGDAAVINETMIMSGAMSRQAFELGNNSLLSEAPSAHSNEDLTFKPEGNQAQAIPSVPEESAHVKKKDPQQTARRAPPPGLPSYVPARFQTRAQPTKERLSLEEEAEQKRLSDELLRSDDEKIERLIGRDTLSHMHNVRSSAQSSNQEDIEDVDFEELLRMSKLEQEENRKVNVPSALVRSQTFDVSRASVDTDLGDLHDSSGSESEGELLSARRVYSKFNSAKRLANVAGVGQNETFQRKFDQIKEHIHMLSDSDDDSGEETPNWADDGENQQRVH